MSSSSSSPESEEEIDQNMAYDAALYLKVCIQSLQEDQKYDPSISKSKVEFISKELSFLEPFLKIMRLLPSNATTDDILMESRVKDAVDKLKDLIVSYIYRDECSISQLSRQLLKAREEISSFSEMLKTNEEYKRREQESYSNFASTTSDFIGKRNVVGLHDQLSQLKDLVLKELDENRLITVTGMTCVGKTTLVQEIYKDPLVVEHFEAYLFLPFGPRYQFKEILLLALHQLGVDSDEFQRNVSIEQLQDCVNDCLFGRRYLAVLDDVWNDDPDFLELCRNILPDDKMSSCIIVTTQKKSLIPSNSCDSIHIRFLDDDESWELLHETVFKTEEERCEPQLEKIGRKIAKKCEGLPLAIIQVGEILSKDKTVEEWEAIAEKEDPLTVTTEDGTPLSNALSLSYSMLPQYLKVCFLYMGVFPKAFKIPRSKLVQLWVSEGFLQHRKKKSLEEIAGEYLDELVSRSCVLREELRSISTSGTKTCKLHFTFRGLCVSEAERENVFHVIRRYADTFPENIDSEQQRLCIHNGILLGFDQVHQCFESVKYVRSLVYFGPNLQYPIVLYLPFKSLKVLDVLAIRFYEFPHQVLDLIQLTYLAITCDGELPTFISCLLNLQVLIVQKHHDIIWPNGPVYLPIEIWKLHELKHLRCNGFDLQDPSSVGDDSLILGRLLTLSGVSAKSCTRGVLARMPRLRKLGVKIFDSVETGFSPLGDFTSLNPHIIFESFKYMVMYPNVLLRSEATPSIPNFPENISKISLSGCGFPWEYMRVMGALPSLKVLKLRCYAFCGAEWGMTEMKGVEEQFPSVVYLLLEDLDIQNWVVLNNGEQFGKLKRLVIRHCYKLKEIPTELLWASAVELDNCSASLVKRIQDWQSTSRYSQVRINSEWDD